MATVTGYTAARMLEIENASIVDGRIDGDDLILVRRDETEILAGDVRGPVGPAGPPGGITDHGGLTGLADDDHPQYHNNARGDARYALIGAVITDHGGLTGLADDDHPQYHNNARGDARYLLLGGTAMRIPHTWHVPGEVKVAVGDIDLIMPFWVPVPAGKTLKIAKAFYKINSGTSATFTIMKNGVAVAGFTSLVATTTAASTTPTAVTLADGDKLDLVINSITSLPKNLAVTLFLEYTS